MIALENPLIDAPNYSGLQDTEHLLRWALDRFHPRIAIATSLQDSVLIHLAASIQPDVRIFSIDTGRLPEETYACAQQINRRLGVRIHWYFPRHEDVERIATAHGPYSFKESLEARKTCCRIRKVEPLARALQEMDAWITGLRRDESITRTELQPVEIDHAHGDIVKVNPLAAWTSADVRDYLFRYRLPYNRLLEQGYPSIGCACCTKPVTDGGDPRSGRWWWELPEHKECGLHVQNWNI